MDFVFEVGGEGKVNKLKVKEAIVVEGRYDKNTLSQLVEGVILETDGFGIFHNAEKMALLRLYAKTRGLIVFTDADGAGFVIRNRIKAAIPASQLKHAYTPDIYGKERRKRCASREGKLGVEGMSRELLLHCLERAGAQFEGEATEDCRTDGLSRTDFYSLGLNGGKESGKKRVLLAQKLGLPARISSGGLLTAINELFAHQMLNWNKFHAIIEEINAENQKKNLYMEQEKEV